jgi:3'(2'), 5'-bisphosphate nucleotidase
LSEKKDFSAELLQELLPELLEIAREAGDKAAVHQPSAAETVQIKGDGSPVTLADRAAHEVIMQGLGGLDPLLPVISEEGDLEGVESVRHPQFWLVDPLDGTKDFLAGRDEYTVNIALVENGEPILGVVVAPANGTAYFSSRGLGAYKQAGGSSAGRIHCSTASGRIRAAVSRSHSSQSTEDYLARLGADETIRSGSSIKICLVAEGAVDVYPRLGPTSIWDTAAAVAVAREAGCEVTDLQGKQLGFDPSGGIRQQGFIAAAPWLLERALGAVDH